MRSEAWPFCWTSFFLQNVGESTNFSEVSESRQSDSSVIRKGTLFTSLLFVTSSSSTTFSFLVPLLCQAEFQVITPSSTTFKMDGLQQTINTSIDGLDDILKDINKKASIFISSSCNITDHSHRSTKTQSSAMKSFTLMIT